MKRLRISRLMDEYTDTEFFPTGGSAVSPERVKARVLAQAMAAAPAGRKQKMPRKKKLLLAAALAAALVLLAGAGFPYIQHRLVGGMLTFEQKADERLTSFVHYGELVKYEESRLLFTQNDGQRIDITDLVSEETPYIYYASDPDTGMVYYIIIGGTPESFGWFEWVQVPYPFDERDSDVSSVFHYDENGNPVEVLYYFTRTDPSDPSRNIVIGGIDGVIHLEDAMKHLWLLTGLEQLGIAFQDAPEDVTVASDTQ